MKKESIKKVYNQTYNFINKFVYLLLPIITCVIFLLICSNNDLYPFGNKSIAWCDMNQQFIPLLNTFKDILEGKQSFSYNLAHGGGMSFGTSEKSVSEVIWISFIRAWISASKEDQVCMILFLWRS